MSFIPHDGVMVRFCFCSNVAPQQSMEVLRRAACPVGDALDSPGAAGLVNDRPAHVNRVHWLCRLGRNDA